MSAILPLHPNVPACQVTGCTAPASLVPWDVELQPLTGEPIWLALCLCPAHGRSVLSAITDMAEDDETGEGGE